MANIKNNHVLCDFWYCSELGYIVYPFEKYADEMVGPHLARFILRFSVLRALLLVWLGRDFQLIAPDGFRYGRLSGVLQAILRNRKIVIFQCVDVDVWRKGPIIAAAIIFVYKYVLGPCMRVSVAAIQVLSNPERPIYVERYGLPKNVLHMVQWPLSGWPLPGGDSMVHDPAGAARHGYVFVSGRNSCDYKTLFAAARLGHWPVVNKNGRATVFSEVTPAEHQRLLAGAAVYALCLKETLKSCGHIRFAGSIAVGVPVVASDVLGLEGYLIDGVTAIAVEAGHPAALARAIENLMNEPELRNALTVAAKHHAAKYTRRDYFSALTQLVSRCLDPNRH